MSNSSNEPEFDVFLSHSAKDRDFVVQLATDLMKAGIRVWLDQWNIRVGDSFADAIDQAIRKSRFILIVMSPQYFQSPWTQQEWHYALAREIDDRGVRLIPLLYEDCEIPPMLRTKQWVDFRDPKRYENVLPRLVNDLHSLASREASGTTTTTAPPSESPKPGQRIEELDSTTISELKQMLSEAVAAFQAKPEVAPSSVPASPSQPIDEAMCFIVMPFLIESLNIVYEDFVRPTLVDRCKLRPERGDDVFRSNVIMDDITKSIRKARLIVADLTGRNPNVFYEVGIAHALNKPVLLMTQSIDDVPFDLRH